MGDTSRSERKEVSTQNPTPSKASSGEEGVVRTFLDERKLRGFTEANGSSSDRREMMPDGNMGYERSKSNRPGK